VGPSLLCGWGQLPKEKANKIGRFDINPDRGCLIHDLIEPGQRQAEHFH
jgi:hypothetical protein